MAKIGTLRKPTLSAVHAFAEGKGKGTRARPPIGQRSGLVPEGDVRLTCNVRGDLHLKLKIRAATERTTIGELIERWVETWK